METEKSSGNFEGGAVDNLNNSVKDSPPCGSFFAEFYLTFVFFTDTIRSNVSCHSGGSFTGASAGYAFCALWRFAIDWRLPK